MTDDENRPPSDRVPGTADAERAHVDPEMRALLAGRRAPDHRAGFWAAVRADLDDHRVVDLPVEEAAGPRSAGVTPVDELARRRRRRPIAALVAAAVVVVALAGATAVWRTASDDDRVDIATDPTVTEPSDADVGALVGGAETDVGPGRVVDIDPTGTHLYVSDDDGSDGFGCEGAPREALYVQAPDGTGRVPALPGVDISTSGGIELAFGPDGLVAVNVFCEGFLDHLLTGRIAADGTIEVLDDVGITGGDAAPVDAVVDMVWGPQELVVSTFSFDTGARRLYTLLPEPSEIIDLGRDGTVHVAIDGEAPAGGPGLVTSMADGSVVGVDGSVLVTRPEPPDVSVLDDGTVVAIDAEQITVVDPDGTVTSFPATATAIARARVVGEDIVFLDVDDVAGTGVGSVRIDATRDLPSGIIRPADDADPVTVVLAPDARTAYIGLVIGADTTPDSIETRIVAVELTRGGPGR